MWVTSRPTSSTMPIGSWPRMSPSSMNGPNSSYRCRSEPQMAVDVTRMIASVGCSIAGRGRRRRARRAGRARSVLSWRPPSNGLWSCPKATWDTPCTDGLPRLALGENHHGGRRRRSRDRGRAERLGRGESARGARVARGRARVRGHAGWRGSVDRAHRAWLRQRRLQHVLPPGSCIADPLEPRPRTRRPAVAARSHGRRPSRTRRNLRGALT